MATSRVTFDAKTVVLAQLALLVFLVARGESRDHTSGLRSIRRNLVATGPTVFSVKDYGAKANGKTNDALAFIKAWNAACKLGAPAKLMIPKATYLVGPVVFQGPCKGSNPIVVEVQGDIKASTDISEYSSDGWFLFELIDGLHLIGGIFDGQGESAWQYNDCSHNKKCQHLPVSLKFNKVRNTLVEGVTSLNSKGFHMSVTFSENFTGNKLNISAPGNSPNTDGIHISSTHLVNITNSNIGTGDDCLGIIQGATSISVSNIFCGPGHGISIGSLGKYPNEKDVIDVHVKNCTLTSTTNGVRIKTFPGDKQLHASNIIYEDIIMNSVKNPIIIDQNYGYRKVTKPSSVQVSDVHFKKIRGTSISEVAVTLLCSSTVPCQRIELADIDLAYNGSFKKIKNMRSSCKNARVILNGQQNPPACQ